MPSAKLPLPRLQHILFHIEGISAAISGASYEDFISSYILQRTVERGVEIISEAAKALPPEITDPHPEIEWRKIIASGNYLRHEYYQIDPKVIWEIATTHLPQLEPVIRSILADLDRHAGRRPHN